MRILHLGQGEDEGVEEDQKESVSLADASVEDKIGELQELCQCQQISRPVYSWKSSIVGPDDGATGS